MSMKFIKRIPTAEEVLEHIPMPSHIQEIKKKRDQEIRNVFANQDDRFLLIVGPCSADNEDSVCEYISKLAEVQEKVKKSS